MNVMVVVAVIAVVVLGGWLYLRVVSPRPEFPPLETRPDDPLMIEAEAKARDSLSRFLELAREPGAQSLVKLPFVSSAQQTEHLWAEVLAVPSDSELDIRLVTPPVTHRGQLERRYTCSLDDVEDWHVRDATGRIHGGFSQRAMFAIARRDGVRLPKRLLEMEREYGDG